MIKICTRPIRHIMENESILKKILLLMLLIIIVPMIALSFMFYSRVQNIIEEEIIKSKDQVVNQYIENVSYKINTYCNFLYNVETNTVIQEIFSAGDVAENYNLADISIKVRHEMDSLITNSVKEDIDNVVLYALNKHIPSDGYYISNANSIEDKPRFKELLQNNIKKVSFVIDFNNNNSGIISMVKPIVNVDYRRNNWGERLGLVQADFEKAKIFGSRLSDKGKNDGIIYIMDSDKKLIYGSGSDEITYKEVANLNLDNLSDINKKIIVLNHKKVIQINKTFDQYGLSVLFFFPYEEVEKKVFDTSVFIILCAGILLILSVIITVFFSRGFSKRIIILVKKMKRVQEGDLEIHETIDGSDEIAVIDSNFNQMTNRLKQLVHENYLQTIEKQKAQIKALQFQINPHFLYNTLECISSMSLTYGCRDIYSVSQKMGEMFRYNINYEKTDYVALCDEVMHIQNYLFIEKVRFKDKFDAIIDIDEKFYNYKVMRFILQPVVENSISHGLHEKRGKGLIYISAEIIEGKLMIAIRDNGLGMTNEQLVELNNYINSDDDKFSTTYKECIGLKNVRLRIKLAYGGNYGIQIESKQNAGTNVAIILPAIDA